VVDATGTIRYANHAVATQLGYAPPDLEGRPYFELIHLDERDASSEAFRNLLTSAGENLTVRRALTTRDGRRVVFGINVTTIVLDGEKLLIGTIRDLTDTVAFEHALLADNAFLAQLIGVSPMVAFRREGPELRLTYVSPNVAEILGNPHEFVVGSPIEAMYALAHPEDRNKMRAQVERALAGEAAEATYRLRLLTGELRWVVGTVRPDPATPMDRAVLGYMFDITSQREVEAELEWLAMHDPLTGLANRAKFESDTAIHLSLSDRKQWTTALFYIDLDQFKSINDRFGHDAGDRVLQTLGERIERTVRDGDLTARLGGDEFVVLLPDVGDEAAAIAERLHQAITTPIAL
jgi:PAS domain S-box-containing protein